MTITDLDRDNILNGDPRNVKGDRPVSQTYDDRVRCVGTRQRDDFDYESKSYFFLHILFSYIAGSGSPPHHHHTICLISN